MLESKRNKYIDNLYTALHTLSGVYTEPINLEDAEMQPNIRECKLQKVKGQDQEVTYLLINPNKGQEGNQMVTSYSQFQEIMDNIFFELHGNIAFYHIRRADMSFNSDCDGDFDLYKKLHRLLLCCLSNEYSVVNCYESRDIWTLKSLNIAIKNDYLEAENYDKSKESHGSVPTTNRLELRSKKIKDNSTLEYEFMKKWSDRLDKASANFKAVQMRYNANLEKLYKLDLAKPKKDREYLNLTAFLMQYKDCIFTKMQMVDLLSRFDEVKNPVSRAENFKKKHTIEYFSQKDLKLVVKALKECMSRYFLS